MDVEAIRLEPLVLYDAAETLCFYLPIHYISSLAAPGFLWPCHVCAVIANTPVNK